jgi:iron complex transport system ATP-binding protein
MKARHPGAYSPSRADAPDARPAALDVRSLSFRYGDSEILRDIHIQMKEGEFVALLGPNGAGKTTLLNILSGVLKPQAGTVRVYGRDLGSLGTRETARLIGVVPQESSSNFNFSNLDIVLMGRVAHTSRFGNESEDDIRRAVLAMKRTETGHLAHRGFMEISGGEKQRVIIAQVLAQEPAILLLDEPTANLDISYQIEIMQLIRSIKNERNLTVLAIFHDMNLAAQFADRVLFLKGGRIRYDDTPENVFVPRCIREIYDVHVMVKKDPFNAKPLILPLYDRHPREEAAIRGVTVVTETVRMKPAGNDGT